MTLRVPRSPVLAISLLGALSCASCASPAIPAEVAATGTPESSKVDVAAYAPLDVSEVTRFIPVSTATLGRWSDIVVTGTIERWFPGESVSSAEGMFFWSSVVAEIHVENVLARNEKANDPDPTVVYVRVTTGTEDPSALAASLPTDAPVLAYLTDERTGDAGGEPDMPDSSAVRKPGAPEIEGKSLSMFVGLQGLAIQQGSEVFWPQLGSSAEGTLADAGPGGPLDGLTDEQRHGGQLLREEYAKQGIDLDALYDAE